MSNEINFKSLTDGLLEFHTKYQTMVASHGIKDIASELKKHKSTIYAEISLENLQTYLDTIENYDETSGRPPYLPKLGLVDVIITILRTGDPSPFVSIARILNLSCCETGNKACNMGKADFLQMLQRFNEEFVQGVNAILQSVEDGKITLQEARKSKNEMMDIVDAALGFVGVFDQVIKEKS